MSRTVFHGAHLLLEGASDSCFWRGHIDQNACQIVICDGKETACKSISGLQDVGITGVVGVVDDDLDTMFATTHLSQNIVITDARDLEAMLLQSEALERVMYDLVPHPALAAFCQKCGMSFRDALVERSLIFARLRYAARDRCLSGVSFDKLSPWKFVNSSTWTVDEAALKQQFAKDAALSVGDVERIAAAVPCNAPWKLIHGHDAMVIWYIALVGKFGIKKLSVNALHTALRLAYTPTALAKTTTYKELCAWSAANQRRLFRRV